MGVSPARESKIWQELADFEKCKQHPMPGLNLSVQQTISEAWKKNNFPKLIPKISKTIANQAQHMATLLKQLRQTNLVIGPCTSNQMWFSKFQVFE